MTEQKQLTLNMEFLWSFCVRGRDGFRCQLYQKDHLKCAGVLQGAHIVTRNVKDVVGTGIDVLDPFAPTTR